MPDAPEIPVALHAPIPPGHTYREISYEEKAGVGYLNFDFYNGAMSTDQCRRLRDAYLYARSRRSTKVIVLAGGADFFSNGIHLNVIEAAEDQGEESWYNLHAIDDVVRDILETDSHIVISALSGDAAAGGVPLALAADHVVAREDVVLNPYYQHMGGLYGSEYWTYLLPRRVGHELTAELTSAPFNPIGTRQRGRDRPARRDLRRHARELPRAGPAAWPSASPAIPTSTHWLEQKRRAARPRRADQAAGRLPHARSWPARHECFFGDDRSYHEARRRFVYKTGAPCAVPAVEPRHRSADAGDRGHPSTQQPAAR